MVITRLVVLFLVISSGLTAVAGDGVAVVELFTSEGCSSCPPADRLLASLVTESVRKGTPVYAIAYHVDYWDRLGWPDRFAHASFSGLQRHYAQHLGERRVFTPQIVVNGQSSIVGSDGPSVREAISGALAKQASVTFDLRIEKPDDRHALVVSVRAHGIVSPTVIRIVAIETGLVTRVHAGENGGRELRHENVVRSAATVKPGTGFVEATLELPTDVVLKNTTVVAMAQDLKTLEIQGARSVRATIAADPP